MKRSVFLSLLLFLLPGWISAQQPAPSKWFRRWGGQYPSSSNSVTTIQPVTGSFNATPFAEWRIIPLDFQKGVDLSMDQIPPGLTPWYKVASTATPSTLAQKVHARFIPSTSIPGGWDVVYHPYRYPVAGFGSGSGVDPMYVGQVYRFGLVVGVETPFNDVGNELVIKVYNKKTGAFVQDVPVNLPHTANASAAGLNGEWKTFGTQGFQTQVNVVVAGKTVMQTNIQFVTGGVPWKKWGETDYPFNNTTSYPLLLSHRALDSSYGFIIAYRGETLASNTHVPYTYNYNPVNGQIDMSAMAEGYAYALDFDDMPAWGTTLLKKTSFAGKPLPPAYNGKTTEEIQNSAPAIPYDYGSSTATDYLSVDNSPELRSHPALDTLVSDLGSNPLALTNFVINEIGFTDGLAYNDNGNFTNASINAGGLNRGALGVYLERQGSPVEQCGLLIYLLRKAGVPATYVFPATNSMKMLDTTMSKILRMQISGALNSDGVSNVPHEIPVNYPWVAAYIGGKWINIFPWLKDTQVVEGYNVWDYMPADVNSPLKWTRAYLNRSASAWDSKSANESPLETFQRKFQDYLNSSKSGLNISQFGYSALNRKHYYTSWNDLPRAWSVDATQNPTLVSNLGSSKADIFDTITFTFQGIPISSPGTVTPLQSIGPLRACDLHNRRAIITSDATGLTFKMQPFRPSETGTSNFVTDASLVQAQQVVIASTPAQHSGFKLTIAASRHRHVTTVPAVETFLNVQELPDQRTMAVNRWDLSAFCLNAGKVTPQMMRVHAEESWQLNQATTPNDALMREITAYVMGMTYYQRMSTSWEQMCQLFKLSTVSVRAFGLGEIGDSPGANNTHTPSYPIVDMAFTRTAYAGGSDFHADSGGQNKIIANEWPTMLITEISALEHLTINRFFPKEKTDAISTVNLLSRTLDNNKPFIELAPDNYVAQGEQTYAFTNPKTNTTNSKKLKDWAGGQWASIVDAFTSGSFGDVNFVRVYITPGPVSGALNTWSGMGTLIMGQAGGVALIGQSLNGAFASPVTTLGNTTPGLTISKIGTLVYTSNNTLSFEAVAPSFSTSAPSFVQQSNTAGGWLTYSQNLTAKTSVLDATESYANSNYAIALGQNININNGALVYTNALKFGNLGGQPAIKLNPTFMVSDPVNTLTGELYVDSVDVTLPGAMPLSLRRNYSSRNDADNTFGYGWLQALTPYLETDGTVDSKYILAAEMDGNVIRYTRDGSTNTWKVNFDDNPELMNNSRLLHNVIVRTTENNSTVFRLTGGDQSVRTYVVKTYQIGGVGGLSRTRPYLQRWSDHSGNFYDFTFSEDSSRYDYGQLKKIASSSGQFLVFNYDSTGHVVEIFTGDGRRLQYDYSIYGDLVKVTRPDGTVVTYDYALQNETPPGGVATTVSTHLLVKETQPEGRVLVNEYEKDSGTGLYSKNRRVVWQKSNVGKTRTGTDVNTAVSVSNSNDLVDESYEPRLMARFDYSNLTATTTTTAAGLSVTKRNGWVTIYDAYNRATYYFFQDNLLVRTVDPMMHMEKTEYYTDAQAAAGNGAFRRSVFRVTDKRGLVTTYLYDTRGNPQQVSISGDLDGVAATTETATTVTYYNNFDLPYRIIAPDPVAGTATGKVTDIAYNVSGDPLLPTEIKVSLGGKVITKTTTSYTTAGTSGTVPFANGLVDTVSAGEDGDMAVVKWVYNQQGIGTGQPSSQTRYSGVTSGDAPDLVLNYQYNDRSELLSVTDAAGRVSKYAYDDMGRRIWEERWDAGGQTAMGWNYVYYNQNGDVEWTDGSRSNPDDFSYARYDGAGRNVESVVWRSQANASGTGVEAVPGADLYATTKKGYNLFGDLIKVMDPRGNTMKMTYDSIGRQLRQEIYEGDWEKGGLTPLAVTTTTYGTVAAPRELIAPFYFQTFVRDSYVTSVSPTGATTTTYHTPGGKPYQQNNPDGTTTNWTYYLDGRIKTEPLGPTTYAQYVYDDANRQVKKTIKNKSGATFGLTQIVTSDARGNVISSSDSAGYLTETYYDKTGRVLRTTQPHLSTESIKTATRQVYDAAGITATTYNALGQKTVVIKDALGRTVSTQTQEAAGTVVESSSFLYLPGGHGVRATAGSGSAAVSTTTYTDLAGHTVLTINPGGSYTKASYDAVGNAVATTKSGTLDSSSVNYTATTFQTYDALNRPVTTTLPDGAKTFMTYAFTGSGSHVTRSMPGPTMAGGQAPVVNGLSEDLWYDSVGRITSSALIAADGSKSRVRSYYYISASDPKNPGQLNYFTQQVSSSSYRTHSYTYDDWHRTATYTCGNLGATDYVKRTFIYETNRNLMIELDEQTSAGTTAVVRDYNGSGRIINERVKINGSIVRHMVNDYDDAGRRSSLYVGLDAPRIGSRSGGSYSFAWQANGELASVTTGGSTFSYNYADNGLIRNRSNPWRTHAIISRDARGRLSYSNDTMTGMGQVLSENLTWFDDDRQASYSVNRANVGGADPGWNDNRSYQYDLGRRRLVQEGFTQPNNAADTLTFSYDQGQIGGLGQRTLAWQGNTAVNPPTGFAAVVNNNDSGAINKFARILRDTTNEQEFVGSMNGWATTGATSLGLNFFDRVPVPAGDITYTSGSSSNISYAVSWSAAIRARPGNYSITANAGYVGWSISTQNTFSIARVADQVSNSYDEEGNVIQRTWQLYKRTQTLTWDGVGRLIKVSERDNANLQGYDWTATYDGLGRRLRTVTQRIGVGGTAKGTATQEDSWYDPLVEFLEIAVEVNGRRTWKVHGPDANGGYGGLQGIGGLEALLDENNGAWTALLDDYYGHIIGSYEGNPGAGIFRWALTRSGSYGPVPSTPVFSLAQGANVATATAWRGHRIDITGFYTMGARYYDPTTGRFISPDPLGHGASMSLYDYADGDPVNFVDPKGRTAGSFDPSGVLATASQRDFKLLDWASVSPQSVVTGQSIKNGLDNFGITVLYNAYTDLRQKAQLLAAAGYMASTTQLDKLSFGHLSSSASDLDVDAYQMTYQFAHGTGPSSRIFTQDSLMGRQLLRTEYLSTAIDEAVYKAQNGDFTSTTFIRQLANQGKVSYVVGFAVDLLDNPTRAFHGSIVGKVNVEDISDESTPEGLMSLSISITAHDAMGATSATHAPPGRNPDGTIRYGSALTPDNPYGPNGPMRTINVNYDMTIKKTVPSSPPAGNPAGFFP